ncbi:MAG: sugar nucleotide-binding protein [Caldilineales bacterium]
MITGAAGFIGQQVARNAASAGFGPVWATLHRSRPPAVDGVSCYQLDVANESAVNNLLRQLRPDVVIHAAYRKDGPGAEVITVAGSGNVARAAAEIGARLVHISSDMVLDGENAPYDESAHPAPVHEYGRAKAAAEALVAASAPAAAIVRTSLVCRIDPPDPATKWVTDSLRTGQPITLFTDEIRCPIWLDDLCAALLELAAGDFSGVINVSGPQALNRYEIGLRLAEHLGLDARSLTPGLSSQSRVRRPRNLTLDTSLARRLLRTTLRSFDEGLAA